MTNHTVLGEKTMVTPGDNYERELERRLWNEGWASFRVAGSGTVSHASADIVAIKKDRQFIFEVKSCWEENMPLDVRDDSAQLMELQDRVRNVEGEESDTVLTGSTTVLFAIRVKDDDRWYFCPAFAQVIPPKEELGKMYKLLMEGYDVLERRGAGDR